MVLQAAIALGAEGAKAWQRDVTRRRQLRRLHKKRGMYEGMAEKQFGADAPLIKASEREAEAALRGGMRSAGTYSPDVAAPELARMRMALGERLAAHKANLAQRSLDAYEALRGGQPSGGEVPDWTQMALGGMAMQDEYGNKEEYIQRQGYGGGSRGRANSPAQGGGWTPYRS